MIRKLGYALLLVFLIGAPGHAEIYCLDNATGDDNNSGICNDTKFAPWATTTTVSNFNFSPGDIVQFRRGDTYQGRLSFGGPNVAGLLTLQDYGELSDPLPIIDAGDSTAVVIRSFRSDLLIENIHLTNARNGFLLSDSSGSKNITIRGIRIDNIVKNGIVVEKGGDNIHISNCRVESGNNGISFLGSTNNKISNVVVDNCVVIGPGPSMGGNDGINVHERSNGATVGTGFLLTNNTVSNWAEQGFDLTSGSNITLIDNTTFNNGEGAINITHTGFGVLITGHHSSFEPVNRASALIFENEGITLRNSLILGPTSESLLRLRGQVSNTISPARNILIENNVFVWDGLDKMFQIGEVESAVIQNNIFISDASSPNNIFDFRDSSTHPGGTVILSHNLYDLQGPATTRDNGIIVSAIGPTDLEAIPNFITPGLDFHLLPGSPAIDTGNPLSSFMSEPAPNGGRINIGRYGNTLEAAISGNPLPPPPLPPLPPLPPPPPPPICQEAEALPGNFQLIFDQGAYQLIPVVP